MLRQRASAAPANAVTADAAWRSSIGTTVRVREPPGIRVRRDEAGGEQQRAPGLETKGPSRVDEAIAQLETVARVLTSTRPLSERRALTA
jgi:hypothetical protein